MARVLYVSRVVFQVIQFCVLSVILQLMFQFLVQLFTVSTRCRSRLDINLSTIGLRGSRLEAALALCRAS